MHGIAGEVMAMLHELAGHPALEKAAFGVVLCALPNVYLIMWELVQGVLALVHSCLASTLGRGQQA